MADPLTAAELEHARWLAANRPDVTSTVVAGLLANLDAQRERFTEVLVDMRHRGVITLDRRKWERYLPDDRDGQWIAYVPFAPMLPDEVEEHYAAHPDARERDMATARRLTEELGEGRDAWRVARGAVPNLGAPSEEIIREARGGEL